MKCFACDDAASRYCDLCGRRTCLDHGRSGDGCWCCAVCDNEAYAENGLPPPHDLEAVP